MKPLLYITVCKYYNVVAFMLPLIFFRIILLLHSISLQRLFKVTMGSYLTAHGDIKGNVIFALQDR